MKRIKRLPLIRNKVNNWVIRDQRSLSLLCHRLLKTIFAIPTDTIYMWATVTDKRPTRVGLLDGYIELKVCKDNMDITWRDPDYPKEGWTLEYTYLELDDLLREHGLEPGAKYYAYFEYE